MTAAPTLTICVPTYNRAEFIGETLESIVGQISDEVEVVIVDGASQDNTAEVVSRIQETCSAIRYYRRETNVGIDPDIDKCIELARGEYCWFVSSDDLVRAGAVERILAACRRRFALIVVNAEIRSFDMSEVLEEQVMRLREDLIFAPTEFDSFCEIALGYLSFFGGVVVRRELWLGRDRSRYYGSEFLHVGVIFQKRIDGESYVISRPAVAIRYANFSWGARRFEVSMIKWPELVWSLEAISPRVRAKVCPRGSGVRLRRLLYHRAMGSFDYAQYEKYLHGLRPRVFERAFAWLIVRVPGVWANRWARSYYRWVRRSRHTLYLLAGFQR